ncbi:hypothetical protein QR680_003900 [Steinernema hermaphroditum]|uniref:LITAF domain-containing protein n=1 Tax=Steinernema hermaphroditum TaxID=289476 RepID=A0AA39LT55_9BILA|nr:hypothetical protein QR680_003900 [Steinernema hermaphroditum]
MNVDECSLTFIKHPRVNARLEIEEGFCDSYSITRITVAPIDPDWNGNRFPELKERIVDYYVDYIKNHTFGISREHLGFLIKSGSHAHLLDMYKEIFNLELSTCRPPLSRLGPTRSSPPESDMSKLERSMSRSVPIPIHRSASHTPSMLVNAKKFLSDRPQLLDCPRCRQHCETEVRFVNGFFTWLSFFVLLIFGFTIFPLFFLWVPFCVGTFKDAEHRCSNCKTFVGTYRRIGKST